MAVRARSVFVNCPFDDDYKPISNAIAFAILSCGFNFRSAAEIIDSGELRLTKIIGMIEDCGLSVHDLSRVELDASNSLPRFNMPLELGIALGMKHLGRSHLRNHPMLILDTQKFRYQKFASDLAGVDISSHSNAAGKAIERVRNFLASHAGVSGAALPGAAYIQRLYEEFEKQLPTMAAAAKQDVLSLEPIDRLLLVRKFLVSLA